MCLLIIALDTGAVQRGEIHLHLKRRKRQPLAAAEIIPVPGPDDYSPILDAVNRAVNGLESEIERQRDKGKLR